MTPPLPLRGRRGRGVRTRGGTRQQIPVKSNEWKMWEEAPLTINHPPFTRPSGPNVEFPNSVVGFVKLFVTDDFLQMIVEQTNLYAEQYLETNDDLGPFSRVGVWKDINQSVNVYFRCFLCCKVVVYNDNYFLCFYFHSGLGEVLGPINFDGDIFPSKNTRLLVNRRHLLFSNFSYSNVKKSISIDH